MTKLRGFPGYRNFKDTYFGLSFELARQILTPSIGANLNRLELEIISSQAPIRAMMRLDEILRFNRVNRPHEFGTEFYKEMLQILKLLNPATLKHFKLH